MSFVPIFVCCRQVVDKSQDWHTSGDGTQQRNDAATQQACVTQDYEFLTDVTKSREGAVGPFGLSLKHPRCVISALLKRGTPAAVDTLFLSHIFRSLSAV